MAGFWYSSNQSLETMTRLLLGLFFIAFGLNHTYAQRDSGTRYFQFFPGREAFSKVKEGDVLVVGSTDLLRNNTPLLGLAWNNPAFAGEAVYCLTYKSAIGGGAEIFKPLTVLNGIFPTNNYSIAPVVTVRYFLAGNFFIRNRTIIQLNTVGNNIRTGFGLGYDCILKELFVAEISGDYYPLSGNNVFSIRAGIGFRFNVPR